MGGSTKIDPALMLLLASKNQGSQYDALGPNDKSFYDEACGAFDRKQIENLKNGDKLPSGRALGPVVIAALKANCKKTNPLLMYQMMQGNKSMNPAMMLALAGNNGSSSMDPLSLLALSGGKMDSNAMMMLAMSNQG